MKPQTCPVCEGPMFNNRTKKQEFKDGDITVEVDVMCSKKCDNEVCGYVVISSAQKAKAWSLARHLIHEEKIRYKEIQEAEEQEEGNI